MKWIFFYHLLKVSKLFGILIYFYLLGSGTYDDYTIIELIIQLSPIITALLAEDYLGDLVYEMIILSLIENNMSDIAKIKDIISQIPASKIQKLEHLVKLIEDDPELYAKFKHLLIKKQHIDLCK